MEYNYYPAQPGHPPSQMPNQPHGCSPMQMMPGANMMHASGGPPPPPQNIRQVITPGPPVHQQMHLQQQQQQQHPPPQQQQHLGHHVQPINSQQHGHLNYHQLPPNTGSPHPQQHGHPHNHQQNLQPPSRPSTGPSPQQHPVHQQSPHLISGPPPPPPVHLQQQPPQQQQLNQISGPPTLPPGVNQAHSNMQQHPSHHHNQTFIGPGPPLPSPHYSPHNQPPPPQPPQVPHSQPLPPQISPMHPHNPQPPPYLPHVQQPNIERGSPFYQNIPQTEFRIIELNKRLQNRPRIKGPVSPLPSILYPEESCWWDKFACDFFDDESTLTLTVLLDVKPVEFTIGRTLIPRFFRSYFDGGVTDLSIKLKNTRETVHQNMITLDCDYTDITTKNTFRHKATNHAMNVVVHTEGSLNLEFISNNFDTLLIKSWRFFTRQCHEYIDRSMTNTGLPTTLLTEPVTRQGLTSKTISYLKMCMIMEPMQDLMLLHRQTKMVPRECLKHLLYEKYKHKSVDDNRAQPKNRRRRKAPAATGATGATKKSKANNANNANAMNSNNIGFNNINNSLMSPSTVGSGVIGGAGIGGGPNLSLASQDVMVVGEPAMLGADFGDENERRITRLENNQFDSPINISNSNNGNNNNISQTPNQVCNNTNQNPNQPNNNNLSHMQQQPQNNHDNGSSNIHMMNHTSGNGNSDHGNTSTNNGNDCLQNNNHQINLISMNGNANHIGHIVKTEMDMKQPATTSITSVTPTASDHEAR